MIPKRKWDSYDWLGQNILYKNMQKQQKQTNSSSSQSEMPRKMQKRNISGLKNQPKFIPKPSSAEPSIAELYFVSNTAELEQVLDSELEDNDSGPGSEMSQ